MLERGFGKKLETPCSENRQKFVVETRNIQKLETMTFVLAITYSCNLKCSYCYQQHDETLKKHNITEENLEKVFNVIEKYMKEHPGVAVDIGLFGGEPLLPSTRGIVEKIFLFCKKNLVKVHIITNGTYLKDYLKLLIINRKLISAINTTVDSMLWNEETRCYRNNFKNGSNSSDEILKCSKTLLEYGVPVYIATNFDRHNIDDIPRFIKFWKEKGFAEYEHFNWGIGRVDDRLYETNYADIISEGELLEKVLELEYIPNYIHSAFMKTVVI